MIEEPGTGVVDVRRSEAPVSRGKQCGAPH